MYFEHSFVGASVIFWGAIVLFVLIGSYFKYKTRSSQHRMMERLAEKGQTLSPELLSSLGNGHGDKTSVSGAIILICQDRHIMKLLEITGLIQLFAVYPTVEAFNQSYTSPKVNGPA